MKPELKHFEFAAAKPDRAAKFYNDVFGWKFSKWDGPMDWWMIDTGQKEIMGGMGDKKDNDMGVVNSIIVDDIDHYMQHIKECGGSIVREKIEIPTVGWLAYFKDTEGNLFGLMQEA